MKEPALIRAVHVKLAEIDPDLWAWKINDPYSAGIPDCLYSGTRYDQFIEYKMLTRAKWPLSVKPDLSPKQIQRLRHLFHRTHHKPIVAVGIRVKTETRIYHFTHPSQWEISMPLSELHWRSIRGHAEFIHAACSSI